MQELPRNAITLDCIFTLSSAEQRSENQRKPISGGAAEPARLASFRRAKLVSSLPKPGCPDGQAFLSIINRYMHPDETGFSACS